MVKRRLLAGFLTLFLFLFLVHPCFSNTDRELVVVLKGNSTVVPYTENDGSTTIRKPLAFRGPAFVGGMINDKEFFAVLGNAHYNGWSDWSFIESLASTSYGNYTNWSPAKIFAKNTRKSMTYSVVGDVTAVMKGNKIFALATSWDESKLSWVQHSSNTGWNPLMFYGNVELSSDSDGGGAYIKWEKNVSLKSILPKTVQGAPGSQFIGGVSNGIVMDDGTIVLPTQVSNRGKQVTSSIMYSVDNGTTWTMGTTTPHGPSECSVVEWGKGKLILNTRYDSGVRIVYESDDMGTTWKESLMFSQVWGNQPNRGDVGCQGSVIKVPVNGKNVLLFSHPLNQRGRYERDTLLLWLSDGQRIMCVGKISEDGKGARSGYSVLGYVNDKLYVMHEINPYGYWSSPNAKLEEWDRVVALSPLPHFYERVKSTVLAWRQLDTKLQAKGVPADGIVGFLGNSEEDDTVWKDMYNCVNATVKGGTVVPGGFCFDGTVGSGAHWPVYTQGQNRVYIFTKYQFTLTATVTIHEKSDAEGVSLIGASGNARGISMSLGLGYSKDNKWFILHHGNKKTTTEVLLEQGKEYHVALTFERGASFVYVNGVKITNGTLTNYPTAGIYHFFMGGIGHTSTVKGSSCTVKNVMLFNRALSQKEITQLQNFKEDDDHNAATSAEEPPSVPENSGAVLTTESLTTTDHKETVVTTEPQTATDHQETVVTTEPQSATDHLETVVTTEPKTKTDNYKRMLTTDQTSVKDDDIPVLQTEPQTVQENHQKLLTTEQTRVEDNKKVVFITNITSATETHKSRQATECKTVSVTDIQNVGKRNENGKNNESALREYGNGNAEIFNKGADGAAVSVLFVPWMCFVCSVVLLSGI